MRIGMIAGETSGDILGAGLVQAILRVCPEARFEGIGGPRMLALGFHSFVPMERLSVMGFIEPLGRLPELLRIKKNLETHFIATPPDVFVGIDSPGFNLRIEKVLHDNGIRTVHYVSPSVWAWGQKRIHKIAQAVDLVLALFPFETAIYAQHNVPVRFIGHPLADTIEICDDDEARQRQVRADLGMSGTGNVIALMPGSRRDEIKRLGAVFLATAQRCLERDPQLRFVIPCANAERRAQVEQMLNADGIAPQVRQSFIILDGRSHDAMLAADVVLLASGTATLEAMLLKRPMVVCYKLAPLTYALASRMLKVPYVALPNLLAGERLVPEFLQDQVTVENLQNELFALLSDVERRQMLAQRFGAIHLDIRRDASAEAAKAVLNVAGHLSGAGNPSSCS
ncbi:MAG: lipid-A-disaccharide synthase [Gammaproteobacteria bacterium]|nr:lipid-A-disaccharide synthase [Gammaproteobacteria bacterium]